MMNLFRKKTRRCQSSAFTLIELLAALAVFSIMMLLLMRFTNVANSAWTQSAANMRVFQNAGAVMDLIDQDFQGIVLSGDKGSEVNIVENSGVVTFVSTVGEPTEDPSKGTCCASKLVEVSYKLDGTTLQRSEVGDNAGGDWDFLGAPSGWETTGQSFEDVITGVEAFSMDIYPNITAPKYLIITMTLVDDRLDPSLMSNENVKNRTKRTFTRTVSLSQ